MCFHHHLVFHPWHSGAQDGAFRDGQCLVLPLGQPWGPCGAAAGWGTAQNPGLGRTGAEILLVAQPGHAGSTFLVQRAPGEEEFKCQIELFCASLNKTTAWGPLHQGQMWKHQQAPGEHLPWRCSGHAKSSSVLQEGCAACVVPGMKPTKPVCVAV